MAELLEKPLFDRDSYLRWEAGQSRKNECLAGKVFAMVDVRREHALVAGAIGAQLWKHTKGSSCQTFISGMKLFVAKADALFYPDIMVCCDERDRRAEMFVEHPALVVEVLSDSTAAYDRGEKFAAYRQIESLKEYLLVDIDHRRLELYRRAEGHWLLLETRDDLPPLHLASVDMDLSTQIVFEDLRE